MVKLELACSSVCIPWPEAWQQMRWNLMQVLQPFSKDGSTRVGDVTLRRERCLVDALQHQLFMRVNAIRSLFRVRD